MSENGKSDKPSYLGLLNAIACAEMHAHEYLTAWADVTHDDDVRKVLRIVATREGEHGMAFAKRIHELGFEVRQREDPKHEERMALARSDRSDLDKLKSIGILDFAAADDEPDTFDGFFRDHTIDIQTGGLLGRYICEERDTLRMLRACRERLEAKTTASALESDRLTSLELKVDTLLRAVEDLRNIFSRAWQAGRDALTSARSGEN
jgi:rubrerythrin